MHGNSSKTRQISLAALFAAAIMVVTMFARVPVPSTDGGYINLGDSVILAAAYMLGGPLGAVCAGVGSALADVLVGAAIYAPGTAIIKALMALAGGVIARRGGLLRYVTASAVAGAIMLFGYALYETLVFDFSYAITALWFNCIQWGGNIIFSVVMYGIVKRVKEISSRKMIKETP